MSTMQKLSRLRNLLVALQVTANRQGPDPQREPSPGSLAFHARRTLAEAIPLVEDISLPEIVQAENPPAPIPTVVLNAARAHLSLAASGDAGGILDAFEQAELAAALKPYETPTATPPTAEELAEALRDLLKDPCFDNRKAADDLLARVPK